MQVRRLRVYIITILIVLALVLAGLIVWKLRGNIASPKLNVPAENKTSSKFIQVNSSRTLPDWLTPVEKSVLNTPSASSSSEIRKQHLDTAVKLARIADKLMIRDCFSIPTVVQVRNGQSLKIENLDSRKHVLSFDRQNKFEIAASTSSTIKINLPKDGLYGYACDYYTKATGLMLVTDK